MIVASDSAEAVARSVASLGAWNCPGSVEVIVAAAVDYVAPTAVLPDGLIRVTAPAGTDVPRLRRLGLDRARGEAVVFTEDSCTFPTGWVDAWLAAFARPETRAATGPVLPAMGTRAIDWAVFFCEYAPFLPERWGRRSNAPSRLAGNNFAVRRDMAARLDASSIHEGEVPGAVGSDPRAVRSVPGAPVGHVRRYSPAEAVRDRLRFGRDYGHRRASMRPPWARFVGLFIGPAVLLAQVARLLVTVFRRGRCLGEFRDVFPITVALLTAWSVGEWIGCALAVTHPAPCPPASPPPRGREGRPPGPHTVRAASSRPRCTTGRSDA